MSACIIGPAFYAGVVGGSGWSDGSLNGLTGSAKTRAKFFGTARVRVGTAFDNALRLVTGGAAWINNKISLAPLLQLSELRPAFPTAAHTLCYTIGGGHEYVFNRNWSAKVEYLYSDFGSKTY